MQSPFRTVAMLFVLVWLGQIGILLIGRGTGSVAMTDLLWAGALSAAIALLWDFAVQRPVRQGLGRLHKRLRMLSVRARPDHSAAGGVADPAVLERLLIRRQNRIVAYARRLRDALRRLQSIYRHSHDAIMLFEPMSGRLVDFNPRATQLLGMTPRQLQGCRLADLHDEDESQLRSLVDDVMDQPHGRSLRINYRAADGRIIPAEVSASRIRLDTGNLLLCIARDISEREDTAQRIQHLAYHDTLTNLPNRTLLTDRVNRALARARRTGHIGALLFLDLDKFKRINDSLGHAIGDELLKELAGRLRSTVREADTVARLGGDEFVILLEDLGPEQGPAVDKAREITDKLREVFTDEYRLDGHELFVTASIGIVTFPHDGDSVDTLLRHADTAMYHAKGAGRDGAMLFERRMDEAAMSRLRLEGELQSGLRERQFELFFQPVLAIRDGHILGAEVLLRWRHPSAGLIAPTEFLPYIENLALMLKLDDWVMRETCRLLGSIQDDPALKMPEYLAVNISRQQFHQPDFVEQMQEIVSATGADPRRLQFEITETVLIKDTEDSVSRMHALKQLGFRFAIDDFGSGYSSLTDLRRLPIDTLKIDRVFIRDIATDPNDAAIVRAIVSMARHLGLRVIAEGVETREQLQALREADCSYYQGYLGRPPFSRATFREELAFSADLYTHENMSLRA